MGKQTFISHLRDDESNLYGERGEKEERIKAERKKVPRKNSKCDWRRKEKKKKRGEMITLKMMMIIIHDPLLA